MTKKKMFMSLIVVVSFLFLLSGCSSNGPIDDSISNENLNTISGQVKVNESAVADVNVSLKGEGLNKSTNTDNNGLYSFNELPDGNYTLTFNKEEQNIDKTKSVTVSGGENMDADLIINVEKANLEDAKKFVEDLKQNGINIKEAGKEQTTKIENNFKQEIIPYTVAIGYRMKEVNNVIKAWSVLMAYGPGDYTVDLSKRNEYEEIYNNRDKNENEFSNSDYNSYRIYSAEKSGYVDNINQTSDDLGSLDIWQWNINFVNREDEVAIKITNLNNIYSEKDVSDQYSEYDTYYKIEQDFSQLDFHYLQTSPVNDSMRWSLDFELNSTDEETFTETEQWNDFDNNTHKEEITITLPRAANLTLNGEITDERSYTDEDNIFADIYENPEDYPEVPPIGKITISETHMDLDFNNDNTINYEGNLSTKEFTYSGNTTINFSSFPTYKKIQEGTAYPQLTSISSGGEFSTDVFKINGSTEIVFTDSPVDITNNNGNTISLKLPDKLTYSGGYEDLTEEKGFTFNGSIIMNPDYNDFNIDLTKDTLENENNYLGGTVSLDGSLQNTDFDEVTLNVEITRDGYKHLSSEFKYEYNNGKYIEGSADYGEEEEFNLNAKNEQNIKIELQANYSDNQDKVGELRNNEAELLGEIFIIDGEPQVNFKDNTIIKLFPNQL